MAIYLQVRLEIGIAVKFRPALELRLSLLDSNAHQKMVRMSWIKELRKNDEM